MSDDLDRLGPDEELDLQAAEYVMGALPPHQARALEALALNQPSLAASISAWEWRLAPLSDVVEPIAPPPILWRRLALATGIDSVIMEPSRPQQKRRGAGLWQGMTLGSLALAASMAYLLLVKPPVAPQPMVAALSPYGTPGATFLVRVGANGEATVVEVGDASVPAGRALQLWAVNGSAAPVSMGLLPANGRGAMTIPAHSGTQLLVSQEPSGGSPTSGPTGPVVYAGKLTGI